MTDRVTINSPDSVIRNPTQLKEKILQVNQMSSHMHGGPLGYNTDRQSDTNGIVSYNQFTKTKADSNT